MSAITDALEREVAAIRALPASGNRRSEGRRNRHFACIMQLIAQRIRHFTQAYGLLDMADDARQACAIGVHRAICDYDPKRARFTTLVNWQLRCELQALRHRVRLDSRDSARRIGARTVSLDALMEESEDRTPFEIEDEGAQRRVESSLASRIAHETFDAMLKRYEQAMRERACRDLARGTLRSRQTLPGTVHPDEMAAIERDLGRERAIVTRYVFAESDDAKFDSALPLDNEKQRQISRRILRNLRAQMDYAALN